jgi:hypothetical protein
MERARDDTSRMEHLPFRISGIEQIIQPKVMLGKSQRTPDGDL